jgi:hypothetical protein
MEKAIEPFHISIEELHQWKGRSRRDNFFELAYINCHTYTIAEPTRFVFIRFTENYFTAHSESLIDFEKWFYRLHFILGGYSRTAGELVVDPADKKKIIFLLELISWNSSRGISTKDLPQSRYIGTKNSST